MAEKRTLHYYLPGDLTGLEYTLNAMSRGGWQAVKPGRLIQGYRREEGAWIHRFGYSAFRTGSADEIAWLAAQERAGWQIAARKKGWILFRKPAACSGQQETGADCAEPDTLVGHRDTIRSLFASRIARMESFRRVMLVLAAALLIGGYLSGLLPILYATALPLLAAAFVTYRIKFLEEGLSK